MSQKHSPRGRLKARPDDPTAPADPTAGKCTAHSKTSGARCRQPAIQGGNVCRYHGGAAPQVKAKAEQRLLAIQFPAIARLAELVEQKEYPSTAMAAVKDVLDRTMGKPTEKVELEVSGEINIVATKLIAARARLAAEAAKAAGE